MFVLVILGYILAISLFSFFVFMAMFYDWRWIKDRHRYAKIPSPKWHFIAGAGLDVIRCKDEELFDYLEKKKREVNSDVMLAPVLGRINVLLFSPDDIEEVFKSFDYVKKGFEYEFLKPWFRKNVTVRSGHDWLKRRNLLMPAFHSVVLQSYIPVFNKHAKILTQVLADHSKLNGCVDIENYAYRSTLNSIIDAFLGVELNCLLGEMPEFIPAIKKAGDLVLYRGLSFWLHNDTLFKISPAGREFYRAVKVIHDFCYEVMNDRKKIYANYETHGYKQIKDVAKLRKSFLDYLLTVQSENTAEFSDDDLIDEIHTILLAGTESVALCLTFTIFLLATNPEVQEKLQQEINDVFNESDREVTIEDLNRLNYMEMVISESLRLYPVFPLISRMLETDLKLKKYTIPSGTNIMVFPYSTHRDPDVYPDPEKFDPDRFAPEAVQARHKYAFLGWSAGYRNCLGRKVATFELKIVLATIFRSLTVSTKLKQKDLKVSPLLALKPVTHIDVTFNPKLT